MSDRYNFSLTTFSPSGKLFQIEYALNAVNQGSLCIGVKVNDGVVLVAENKSTGTLVENSINERVAKICETSGILYSGMGPDARLLILRARKIAQLHKRTFGEFPPASILARDLAGVMQEFTQSGGVRPFGVSILLAGFDCDDNNIKIPSLYQLDPSGTYWKWKATAIGQNSTNAKAFLEKRYKDDLAFEDAIHAAIQTMRQSFDGKMNNENVQIGILDRKTESFKILSHTELEENLIYSLQ